MKEASNETLNRFFKWNSSIKNWNFEVVLHQIFLKPNTFTWIFTPQLSNWKGIQPLLMPERCWADALGEWASQSYAVKNKEREVGQQCEGPQWLRQDRWAAGEEEQQGKTPPKEVGRSVALSRWLVWTLPCSWVPAGKTAKMILQENVDVNSNSSTRLKVLNLYNVVSYCPKHLKVYFHFPLVLGFTNSNKKILSLLMDIFPLNNYPNLL